MNLQKEAFKEFFVISQKTLEEIENIKTSSRKDGEVKYQAREIARLLNKSYKSIDSALQRIRVKLKKILNEMEKNID